MMAYLLRFLLFAMMVAVLFIISVAHGWPFLEIGHIVISIPVFIAVLFIQSFTMFYFIGIERLTINVLNTLQGGKNLEELFDHPPADLGPYLKETSLLRSKAKLYKRQTIPWSMLTLILGSTAFLLGGAYDTGLVGRSVHSGVAYGFFAALSLGFVRQWYYLGKGDHLLSKLKGLFEISRHKM